MLKNRKWITNDWIKLIVALVLLFLVFIFPQQPAKAQQISFNPLPAYPDAEFLWQYDVDNESLLDPQGIAVYSLTGDGKRWQPVIPPEVLGQLPSGYQLLQNIAGDWVILDEQGQKLAGLDYGTYRWKAVIKPSATATATDAATATPLPTYTRTLQPTATLPTVTPTDQPTATLPTFTPTNLPTATQPAFTPTNLPTATLPTSTPTHLPTATRPVFTPTQQATATPVPTKTIRVSLVSPTPISGECPASAPSQLAIGDVAVAQANLYLRKVPYVADNVVTYNLAGAELTILDGPECVPHADGYYIWWLVESPYGLVGWTAETTLHSGEYLMVPVR